MSTKSIKTSVIKRGNVYDAWLGEGIGSEQQGFRPVIVIQNDIGNRFSTTVIVAPITSQVDKADLPTHVKIDSCKALGDNSFVILEQVRTIDKKRLKRFKGSISLEDMRKVEQGILISFGMINTYVINEKVAMGV